MRDESHKDENVNRKNQKRFPDASPPEKIRAALALLSLSEDCTHEEMLRAYHKKLFELHPDTAPGDSRDAGRLVSEIVTARKLLQAALEAGTGSDAGARSDTSARRDAGARNDAGAGTAEGGPDGYEWYRQAAAVFSEALDEYWQERLKYSQFPENSPVLARFREKLLESKRLFGNVLDRFPGGIWTPDAVERIARINLWLRRQ